MQRPESRKQCLSWWELGGSKSDFGNKWEADGENIANSPIHMKSDKNTSISYHEEVEVRIMSSGATH